MIIFVGGGQREGYWGHILLKTPKMALISEYLAADLSPDASADALAIINIRVLSLSDQCLQDQKQWGTRIISC